MRLQKSFLVVLIFIAAIQICFGQTTPEYVEGENWVQQYGIYASQFIMFRYDRYSKEDTLKFREKLDLLKEAKFADEWEGIYIRGGIDLGFSQLRWDSNIGFAHFYIYTCVPELSSVNYGKVTNSPQYIQTIPEFIADSPRKANIIKYVKVKWGNQHYLVDESSLPEFAEQAVGIYVLPEESSYKGLIFWVKGDSPQEFTGAPEFPASYKKFQRQPIETIITSVKRTIEQEVEIAGTYYTSETAVYKITIGAGAIKGVKKGMDFYSPELNTDISIVEVNRNSAVGVITRYLDENQNDHCVDDEANKIPCPVIKPSLKIKTRIGIFWV